MQKTAERDHIKTINTHIADYLRKDIYPFHMPGHKRNAAFLPMPDHPAGLLALDMTELGDMDDLHNPTGMIKDMQRRIAGLYGAAESFFLVNGASAGIMAAIGAACGDGEPIAVARNCHRSVYHGLVLSGAYPVYIAPEITPEGFAGGITARALGACLEKNPAIKTAVVTSPTYEGFVSDIAALADLLHARGGVLIVDEAHGAHFPFHAAFPSPAIRLGADMVVNSLHKTLPALSQCAVLHVSSECKPDADCLRFYLRAVQTSSPSYILLATADHMLTMLSETPDYFQRYVRRLGCLRDALTQSLCDTPLRLFGRVNSRESGIADTDIGKLLFVCNRAANGLSCAETLAAQYGVQMEMAGRHFFLAMTSVADTEAGYVRLLDAVTCLARDADGTIDAGEAIRAISVPEVVIPPRQAVRRTVRWIPVRESIGGIAGALIMAYPPGIPLLAPGERITAELLQTAVEQGLVGETICVMV